MGKESTLAILFRAWDRLPSKIFGVVAFSISTFAVLRPQIANQILDRLMTDDQIQFWGVIGFIVCACYWALWLWLKRRIATKQALKYANREEITTAMFNVEEMGALNMADNKIRTNEPILKVRKVEKVSLKRNDFGSAKSKRNREDGEETEGF
ncbi:hypothetical protein [Parasphingorhabdus sp.]|uniref:hypothetical protein n=1 Tax=Parasphingorhabdus sp. TaxID=2709688 RepID=UPI002F95FC6A